MKSYFVGSLFKLKCSVVDNNNRKPTKPTNNTKENKNKDENKRIWEYTSWKRRTNMTLFTKQCELPKKKPEHFICLSGLKVIYHKHLRFCLYKNLGSLSWNAWQRKTLFDNISNSDHGHVFTVFTPKLTWQSICRIRCPSRTMESFLASPCSQPALFLFQSEDWTTPDLLIVGIICYKNATLV